MPQGFPRRPMPLPSKPAVVAQPEPATVPVISDEERRRNVALANAVSIAATHPPLYVIADTDGSPMRRLHDDLVRDALAEGPTLWTDCGEAWAAANWYNERMKAGVQVQYLHAWLDRFVDGFDPVIAESAPAPVVESEVPFDPLDDEYGGEEYGDPVEHKPRLGGYVDPIDDDDAPILTEPLKPPVRPKTIFHPVPISRQPPPPVRPPSSMVRRGGFLPRQN